MINQTPTHSGAAMMTATVMLSSASRPPRIAQHSPYSRQLSDKLTAVAACHRRNGDLRAVIA